MLKVKKFILVNRFKQILMSKFKHVGQEEIKLARILLAIFKIVIKVFWKKQFYR